MELHDVWFVLIAVLWTGYFFLEGFDFGVGMLLPVLGRDDRERRVLINTIGPVWDGNEVWLLVAGGATFAAFPEWYATLFSGFYLPLLLILVCLIVRGVAFEYRGKRAEERWQRNWEHCHLRRLAAARRSCGAWPSPTSCAGVKIDAEHEYVGGVLRPAQPVRAARRPGHADAVHLPRRGVRRAEDRRGDPGAGAAARRCGSAWPPPCRRWAFLLWTQVAHGDGRPGRCSSAAVAALVGARRARTGRGARAGRSRSPASTIVAAVAMLFLTLFPNVMPSTLDDACEPHGHQRLVQPVHPEDHDLGARSSPPRRAALPGLDLLGVPQAASARSTSPRAVSVRIRRETARSASAPVRPRHPGLPGGGRGLGVAGAALVVAQAMLIAEGGGRRLPGRRRPAELRTPAAAGWPPSSPAAGRVAWLTELAAHRASGGVKSELRGRLLDPAGPRSGPAGAPASRRRSSPSPPGARRPGRLLRALSAAAGAGRRRARRVLARIVPATGLGGDHRSSPCRSSRSS